MHILRHTLLSHWENVAYGSNNLEILYETLSQHMQNLYLLRAPYKRQSVRMFLH